MMRSGGEKPSSARAGGSAGRDLLWAAGGLLLLTMLFYAPVLSGMWTFPDGDFTHHFLPFSQYMATSWRTLTPPLWNPFTYAGHPFLADVQAAALYPVSNFLLLLTIAWRSDAARLYLLELEAVAHIALAGWFTFLLARELTGRLWPAALAGITFMLSGYLTGYPPLQLAVLRTAVWLPLILWMLLRAWQDPARWRYWFGAGVAMAVAFLAGHSQTWMYTAYAVVGWVAALVLGHFGSARKAGGGTPVQRVAGLIIFGLTAVGLSAAQLLPSLEFARLSVRADVDYAYVSGGFPLRDTWQALLPGVLTQFSPLYVGVVGLAMALFGAIEGMRGRSAIRADSGGITVALRMQRFAAGYFLTLAVFGLLVAYGENGFLYPMLHGFAPGWDMFRGQERAAYLVAFGLSLLAAYGLAYAPVADNRSRRRFALLYGALITAGVYAFGLLWVLPGHAAIGQWRYLIVAAVTLAMAMTLAVSLWLSGWSVRRDWLICGLAAANLILANMGTNLERRTLAEAVAWPPEVAALRDAVWAAPDTTGLDGRAYNEFRVYDDYGMQSGIEDVWGSSPLRLSTYAAFFDDFPLDRMFRLTGVGHVLTWRQEMFEPSDLLTEFPQTEDATYIHRLTEPNPRLWVVGNAVSADDEAALDLLADHEFDLDKTVVLPSNRSLPERAATTAAAQVHAARLQPHRLDVSVIDSGGGVLVVSENWMPGWRVTAIECEGGVSCEVGGAHTSGLPLLAPVRANVSLVAIALPAGDVRFILEYAPDSVRTGLIISSATILLLCAVAISRAFSVWRSAD